MGAVLVRFYAGAADAAGCREENVTADTVGALRTALLQRHGDRLSRILAASTVLIGDERVTSDEFTLRDDTLVEILPPYAGG